MCFVGWCGKKGKKAALHKMFHVPRKSNNKNENSCVVHVK